MSDSQRQFVEVLDLDRLRGEPDKLYNTAKDLRREVLRLYAAKGSNASNDIQPQQTQTNPFEGSDPSISPRSSFPFWSGRQWIPAESEYPTDWPVDPGCFGFGRGPMEVVVFDVSTMKPEIWSGLDQLKDRKALFARLPSKRSKSLRVCVEKITTQESSSAPRYRVTDKKVPSEMTCRHTIEFGRLSTSARLKILSGSIKWIFVLNVSREFSNYSKKSA